MLKNGLASLLYDRYGINTSTQIKGKGLRIYIKSGSYEVLCKLILPHLLPSMEYKFPRPKTASVLINNIDDSLLK